MTRPPIWANTPSNHGMINGNRTPYPPKEAKRDFSPSARQITLSPTHRRAAKRATLPHNPLQRHPPRFPSCWDTTKTDFPPEGNMGAKRSLTNSIKSSLISPSFTQLGFRFPQRTFPPKYTSSSHHKSSL